MTTETLTEDDAPREDPREARSEKRTGTIDLDGTGAGSHTVSLSGDIDTSGLGPYGAATAADGTASLSSLTSDSVDIDVTGGTADATDVAWELVVTEDRHR